MFVLMDWLSRRSRRECGSSCCGQGLPNPASPRSMDPVPQIRIQWSILSSYHLLTARFIGVAWGFTGLSQEHDRSFWGGAWGGRFCKNGLPRYSSKILFAVTLLALCSCTIMSQSPYLAQKTGVTVLEDYCGLKTSENGRIPYQRWLIPPWDEDARYVWLVGDYDFRMFNRVDMILYFHGTQPKDYYEVFRKELEKLAAKRPDRPFVFVGLVDKPNIGPDCENPDRWGILVPKHGERPEALFEVLNQIFKAFRASFPNVKKDNTHIVLTGFSGGGKVLRAIGNWLARSDKDDPYAEVFRSRLSKIVYFDCWFSKDVVETVPALLEDNPDMKIVGTVHMKKPTEHASIIANKFNMKADKQNRELMTPDGRLTIYKDDSHWQAMIGRLKEAL
jgi:hypothetical protein